MDIVFEDIALGNVIGPKGDKGDKGARGIPGYGGSGVSSINFDVERIEDAVDGTVIENLRFITNDPTDLIVESDFANGYFSISVDFAGVFFDGQAKMCFTVAHDNAAPMLVTSFENKDGTGSSRQFAVEVKPVKSVVDGFEAVTGLQLAYRDITGQPVTGPSPGQTGKFSLKWHQSDKKSDGTQDVMRTATLFEGSIPMQMTDFTSIDLGVILSDFTYLLFEFKSSDRPTYDYATACYTKSLGQEMFLVTRFQLESTVRLSCVSFMYESQTSLKVGRTRQSNVMSTGLEANISLTGVWGCKIC